MKYLELYYKWMESGCLPDYGLCSSMPTNEWLEIFKPEDGETYGPWAFGKDQEKIKFKEYGAQDRRYATDFTPLRQTIVLFMAAMNGEL